MATFNLTAQLNLKGPTNVKQIAAQIKKDLGALNANVQFKLDPAASKNVAALSSSLKVLNANFASTVKSANAATAAIKSFSNSVNSVKINNVPQQINQTSSAIAKLNKVSSSTSDGLQNAATEMQEFGKQAGLAVRRFVAFSAVTSVIYGVTNSINNGIQAFIDYDKELVKLQQVTGESAAGLSKLQSQISNLAVEFGVSSKELTQVASTLAQAGLSARETEKSLRALALSSLAPSFDNMNETVEGSIALMRQFGISADDLEASLGAVNTVAARFAVESSDIITAIQRTGSVFATASKGVSEGKDALNEFISVFTSVRATTRESAETIATGLRTIFTRIQRGTTIDALKEFGVNLTDAEGKFVGAYKAVELLSKGLGKIDPRSLDFSRIVEELGGFRQIGKVIPLIQQFSVAQQALKVAQQGQGSLAKDAATAQLSLANQISKVREEFFSLFREIGQSKGFQSLIRGALSLTSGLIKVADAVKGILPALAVLAAFKGFKALTEFTTGFATGVKRGPDGKANGGVIRKFARGGVVPGTGSGDTVPAMLEPGEFVIRKKAVETIGTDSLHSMNKYGGGGSIRSGRAGKRKKFAKGGIAQIKNTRGARDGDSWYVDYIPDADPVSVTTRGIGYDAYELNSGKQWEKALGLEAKKMANNYFTDSKSKSFSNNSMLFRSLNQGQYAQGRPLHKVPSKLKRDMINKGVAKEATKDNTATGSGGPSKEQIKTLEAIPGFNMRNLKVQESNLGGKIQKFAVGGKVTRNLGYIDFDIINDPANAKIIEEQMKKSGTKGPREYTQYLTDLATKARKDTTIKKLTALYGVAGAGKSSIAMGRGANDAGRLRETNRFPILTPDDISKASEVMLLTSTVSKDKLDGALKEVDKIYALSTTTQEEKDRIRKQRMMRDVSGVGLFGRKAGATTGVPTDSAKEEALLTDRFGSKAMILGRGNSGRLRRKRGNELVEITKKQLAFTWGGFSPTTAGHESIMDAAKASGIPYEDFIALVGANEAVDAQSYRTAVFDQDFRLALAKAGFGSRGASVLPKAFGDMSVPLAFDMGERGGRRQITLPAAGSMAFVADKTDKQMAKYIEAGYGVTNLERTGGISGTQVRDLVLNGNLEGLQKVVSPGVFSLLKDNLPQLQNRSNILPSLIQQAQDIYKQQVASIDEQLAATGITRADNKKAAIDPDYAAQLEIYQYLKEQKKKLATKASFEPYRLLKQLAEAEPDKYALKLDRAVAEGVVGPSPVSGLQEAILKKVAKETAVKKSSGILPAQGSEILKRFGTERLPNDPSFGPFSGKTVRDTAEGGKLKYWNSAFRPETKADKLAYYTATRDYLIDKFNESQGSKRAAALEETANAVLSSKQLGLVGLNPLGYTGLLGPETWNLGTDSSGKDRSINASIVQRGLPTEFQNVIDYLSGQTAEIVQGASKLLGITPKELTKKQRETLGQGNIEGALLEQIFGSADATILDDALRTRPIDFPMGIGPKAAKIFGIDPNIPTEVKRTIDSGSRAKAVEEFQRFFRQKYGIPDPEKVAAFAEGGPVKDVFHGTTTGKEDSVLRSFQQIGARSDISTGFGQGSGFYVYGGPRRAKMRALELEGGTTDFLSAADPEGKPLVLKFTEPLDSKNWDIDYELQNADVVDFMYKNYDRVKESLKKSKNQDISSKFKDFSFDTKYNEYTDPNDNKLMRKVGISFLEDNKRTENTLANVSGDVRTAEVLTGLTKSLLSSDPDFYNEFEQEFFNRLDPDQAIKYVGPKPIKPVSAEIFQRAKSINDTVWKAMQFAKGGKAPSLMDAIFDKNIYGPKKEMVFDFDDTLVTGGEIRKPDGSLDLSQKDNIPLVQEMLKKGRLTPLGQYLSNAIKQEPSLINNLSILSARNQNQDGILADTLSRLGLPIPVSKIKGSDGPQNKKITNYQKMIDDNLETISRMKNEGKEAILYKFANGGKVEEEYKQILASILPKEMLTGDGYLKMPSGKAEPINFIAGRTLAEKSKSKIMSILLGKSEQVPPEEQTGAFYQGGLMAKVLRHNVEKFKDKLPADEYKALKQIADHRILFEGNDDTIKTAGGRHKGVLPHETFHDIQGYLYDNHPEIIDKLHSSLSKRQKEVEEWYKDPKNSEWTGPKDYQLEHFFPTATSKSPYSGELITVAHDIATKMTKRDASPQLFSALGSTQWDFGKNELVPVLLSAAAERNSGAIKLLSEAFSDSGLNPDFYKTLPKYASGGRSPQDTVPALLTPGEFVINKKAAQNIGYSKLEKLNKADKIQGYNKGGIVGGVQRFAFGGGVDSVLSGLQNITSYLGRTNNITNNRPNSIDTSTIAVDPSILQETKAFVDTLYDAGDGMKYLNRLLNENKQLSIQAVLEAGNKDLERLKISGASIDKIIEAEKALSNIRNKGLIDVTNRQFLESGFKESSVGKKLGSGATQQKILSLAEKEERRLIDKRKKAIEADIVSSSKQPISPSDLADQVAQAISSELNDIKTQAFSRATAAATGTKTSTGIKGNITESELKNLNITGNDIQKYISDSMRDRKTLRQMDQQLIAMRMEEYKNAGTVRGISVASAEEAKKLAQEEVSKRREAINDLAKMRGERGVGAAGLMDTRNSPINRAFRERYFTGDLGKSMQRGLGDIGLAAGLVAGQGDNIASALFDTKTDKGKIQAADTGARIDKAATTLSVGLTTSAQLAAINPMLGAAAAIGTALYAGADAVYDFSGTAKKAAQEMARALLNDKLSAASDNLSNALEKLSRDANNVELRAKTASAIKSLTDTALESTADTGITGKNKAETERNWSDFGRGILLAVGEIGVGMNPFYQDMDPVTLAKSKQGSYGMEEARVDAQKEAENFQKIANAGYTDLERLYAKGFTNDQIMDPTNEAGNIVRESIKGMILADSEKRALYMAAGPQGKEAIAGTAAQQAFLANDELAKASQEAAKLARAMEIADKAGRRLAASFDKIADIVNESVNRISFESDARVEAANQYASSLRGESRGSGPKLRERNILENPNAYSEAEFTAALQSATAGLSDGLRKQLIGGAQLQQNIPKNITKSIATVLDNSAGSGVDELKKAAVDTAKNEIENNANLSRQQKDELKQIATARIENIAKKAKDNNADNTTQVSEFRKELEEGTSVLGDFGKKLLDSIKGLSSFKEGALDKFAKGLNEASKAAKEAENYFRKSREISNEGNMNLREILSGYGETYNEKNNRIMGDVGALAGGQTTVQGIKNRQIMLSGQRDVLQKQQDTLTDKDALRNNVEQLNKLDDQLRDNREALDMLANSTELVDKAFSNLQNTAELQNNRQNFVNQLLTNTPEEADKLNQSFIRLQRNLSGGLNSPYNQRDARKAFNEALFKTGNVREATRAGNTVLANQRKETLALSQDPGVRAAQELQIRNQYAQNRGRPGVDADQAVAEYFQKQQLQLTKQMAIESGMINNPLVQQSLAALEDRKADPAMQQAAERYLEAVGLRANATKAQGELAVIESQSILKNSNDNLRISIDDLRASIEGNLKNANIGMDAAGNRIVNPGVAVPAPAVARSSGGLIYASSGKLIDFKPKGTDTVPAMLSPGEFVINSKSTQKHLPLLQSINAGYFDQGGLVSAFEKFDKNKNSLLDVKEFSKYFSDFDLNKNDLIDMKEFRSGMNRQDLRRKVLWLMGSGSRTEDQETEYQNLRSLYDEIKSGGVGTKQEMLDRAKGQIKYARQQAYLSRFRPEIRERKEKSLLQSGMLYYPDGASPKGKMFKIEGSRSTQNVADLILPPPYKNVPNTINPNTELLLPNPSGGMLNSTTRPQRADVSKTRDTYSSPEKSALQEYVDDNPEYQTRDPVVGLSRALAHLREIKMSLEAALEQSVAAQMMGQAEADDPSAGIGIEKRRGSAEAAKIIANEQQKQNIDAIVSARNERLKGYEERKAAVKLREQTIRNYFGNDVEGKKRADAVIRDLPMWDKTTSGRAADYGTKFDADIIQMGLYRGKALAPWNRSDMISPDEAVYRYEAQRKTREDYAKGKAAGDFDKFDPQTDPRVKGVADWLSGKGTRVRTAPIVLDTASIDYKPATSVKLDPISFRPVDYDETKLQKEISDLETELSWSKRSSSSRAGPTENITGLLEKKKGTLLAIEQTRTTALEDRARLNADTEKRYQELSKAADSSKLSASDQSEYIRLSLQRGKPYSDIRALPGDISSAEQSMRSEAFSDKEMKQWNNRERKEFNDKLIKEKSSTFYDKVAGELTAIASKNVEDSVSKLTGNAQLGQAAGLVTGFGVGTLAATANPSTVAGGVAGAPFSAAGSLALQTAAGTTASAAAYQAGQTDAAIDVLKQTATSAAINLGLRALANPRTGELFKQAQKEFSEGITNPPSLREFLNDPEMRELGKALGYTDLLETVRTGKAVDTTSIFPNVEAAVKGVGDALEKIPTAGAIRGGEYGFAGQMDLPPTNTAANPTVAPKTNGTTKVYQYDLSSADEYSQMGEAAKKLINKTKASKVQKKASGGMIYASNGRLAVAEPSGTDTVPAMLTPGEFVVNAKATKKNLGLLQSINRSKGGPVNYLAKGGKPDEEQRSNDAALSYDSAGVLGQMTESSIGEKLEADRLASGTAQFMGGASGADVTAGLHYQRNYGERAGAPVSEARTESMVGNYFDQSKEYYDNQGRTLLNLPERTAIAMGQGFANVVFPESGLEPTTTLTYADGTKFREGPAEVGTGALANQAAMVAGIGALGGARIGAGFSNLGKVADPMGTATELGLNNIDSAAQGLRRGVGAAVEGIAARVNSETMSQAGRSIQITQGDVSRAVTNIAAESAVPRGMSARDAAFADMASETTSLYSGTGGAWHLDPKIPFRTSGNLGASEPIPLSAINDPTISRMAEHAADRGTAGHGSRAAYMNDRPELTGKYAREAYIAGKGEAYILKAQADKSLTNNAKSLFDDSLTSQLAGELLPGSSVSPVLQPGRSAPANTVTGADVLTRFSEQAFKTADELAKLTPDEQMAYSGTRTVATTQVEKALQKHAPITRMANSQVEPRFADMPGTTYAVHKPGVLKDRVSYSVRDLSRIGETHAPKYITPVGQEIANHGVESALEGDHHKAKHHSSGGLIYANNGALIKASGTDNVPAMLTEGEFVINREASKKNMPILQAINSGYFNRGGIVNYLANGGIAGPQYLAAGGRSMASISNSNILPELLNKLSNTGMNSSGGASQLAPLSNVVQTLKQTASSAGGVSNNVSIDTANISSSIQDAVTNAIGQFNEYTEQIGANFTEQFGAAQKSLSSSINTFQTATAQFGEHANAIPTSLSANVTQTTSLHHIGLESIKGNMEKNIYDNTSVSSKNIAQDTVMQYDKTVFEGGMNSAAKPSIMGRPS